jgi:tripartite-type tricarboxylate transporter receptor subunit TctC
VLDFCTFVQNIRSGQQIICIAGKALYMPISSKALRSLVTAAALSLAAATAYADSMAKVKIQAIPYKGGAPAITAVIAGEIPVSVNPLPEVVGQIEGNAVRALAVTTAQRSKALPDVPTVAEAGLPGYDASVWWGFLGPAGMAPELLAKIHADLAAALKDPVVLSALEKMGATPVGSSPRDFDAYIRAEAAKWEPVLKEANIKVQ